MKRLVDVAVAALGLVALMPLMVLIAAAIWSEDRRCPLFLGKRVGRDGVQFPMVKFRTMVPDAWKSGVNSTATGDARITRFGRLLRRTKLDEIPQLWNVLTGDMSLAGPRPQVAAEVALYTATELKILHARPGVTDLASIVFSDESEILAGADDPDLLYNQVIRPWKSRLALAWSERSNLAWDLLILGCTIAGAFSRDYALAGVAWILTVWGADPMLIRVARRREPLVAWPPPGGTDILPAYPRSYRTTLHVCSTGTENDTSARILR